MTMKISLGAALGLFAAILLAVFKPWKGAGAGRLRNAQGIGPSHIAGAQRGEAQAPKGGSDEPVSVAGRIAGSIDPQ
jgi:hypothetical protein